MKYPANSVVSDHGRKLSSVCMVYGISYKAPLIPKPLPIVTKLSPFIVFITGFF